MRTDDDDALADIADEALMRRVAQGDRLAFTELVGRHRDRAMRVAYAIVRLRAEAEDIVQDCFLRVWVHAPSWEPRPGGTVPAWIARIAANLAIDRTRRHTPAPLEDAGPLRDDGLNPEQEIAGRQIGRRIDAAMAALPERQRTAFALCQIERMSNADAADALGISTGAIELLLVRARRALRRNLADLMPEHAG